MPHPLLILAALVTVGVALLARGGRRVQLAAIRARWGRPLARGRDVDRIAHACRTRLSACRPDAVLDDRTWRDLDLDQVFAAIDRTESILGSQALYHRLHSLPMSDHLDAFEALVTRMGTDAPARERAQLAVARLHDPHGYDPWWLAKPDAVETHPWYVLFPLLTASTITLAALAVHWHFLVPWLLALLAVDLAVRFLAADRASALGSDLGQVAPIVAAGEALTFLHGDDIAPIVGNLQPDIACLGRLKTIARWLSGDPLMRGLESGGLAWLAASFTQAIYEYLNLLLLLDANGIFLAARDLRAHGAALLRVTAAVGDIDAAVGVASWRTERDDWSRPEFVGAGSAVLRDLRHPLIEHAVANSVVLEPGRGMLVTGSNMSGKSTFLRTVGVNAVLAQTINTCLASSYEAPVFRVESCIGRADDLLAGKSYYVVEVEQVLARLRSSVKPAPHLFLFDELFRGTNAIERIAAAEAVLRALVDEGDRRQPHVVLAATHDAELVELLSDRYHPYHFTDTVGPEGLVFEYRLEAGPATTRNAIALLQLNGAPESVVRCALARAAELDARSRAGDGA